MTSLPETTNGIDRPSCPVCGKRILWIMRAAGCCLGPFKELRP